MALLVQPADMATVIYQEIIDEITRNDYTILSRAIASAIAEAKMYLSRYDLIQLFGSDTIDPTLPDEYLKSLVKDLAAWHVIKLSNANLDYNHIRSCYEDAVSTLKMIQRGQSNPEGWPYKETTGQTAPNGDSVEYSSNCKRNNYL